MKSFNNAHLLLLLCLLVQIGHSMKSSVVKMGNRYVKVDLVEDKGKGPVLEEGGVYGQIIMLGNNGKKKSLMVSEGREIMPKMSFKKREEANGIKKDGEVKLFNPGTGSTTDQNTMVFTQTGSQTIVMGLKKDQGTDMFQIGVSKDDQIDFVIASENRQVSRYACRIVASRDAPHPVQIFAAGFDSKKQIFIGEKAPPAWEKPSGGYDKFTTNGILMLRTDWKQEKMYTENNWREVSVDGDLYRYDVYTRRIPEGPTQLRVPGLGETNELKDGTLIDLHGVTLLWRSPAGLASSPSERNLNEAIKSLNKRRPFCPVDYETKQFSCVRHSNLASSSSRVPMPVPPSMKDALVYFPCGHVQGSHDWNEKNTCPFCTEYSSHNAPAKIGMEAAFHLDLDEFEHAFNPCGHIASERTVRFWSNLKVRKPIPPGVPFLQNRAER